MYIVVQFYPRYNYFGFFFCFIFIMTLITTLHQNKVKYQNNCIKGKTEQPQHIPFGNFSTKQKGTYRLASAGSCTIPALSRSSSMSIPKP